MIQHFYKERRQEKSSSGCIAKRAQTIFRMRREQDRAFAYAFGLTDAVNWKKSTQRRLLFKKSQISLLIEAGLTKLVANAQDSHKYSVRSDAIAD